MDLCSPWKTKKKTKKTKTQKNKNKKQFKCKCIKTSRWKPWHLDWAAEWILALLHTNELKVRDKEHLLGISSGCPAGPGRRRCPLRLVPFWTPPAKHKRVVTFKRGDAVCRITRCWTNRVSAEWGGGIKVNEMSCDISCMKTQHALVNPQNHGPSASLPD